MESPKSGLYVSGTAAGFALVKSPAILLVTLPNAEVSGVVAGFGGAHAGALSFSETAAAKEPAQISPSVRAATSTWLAAIRPCRAE